MCVSLRQGLSLNLELTTDWTVSPRDLAVSALSVSVTHMYCETLLCPWFWVHEVETSCLCGRNVIHGATSLALKGLLKALSFAFGEWTIGSLVISAPASIRTIRILPRNSLAQRVSQVGCTATSTVRLSPLSVSVSPLENFYTSFLYWLSQQTSSNHKYTSTSYHLPEASSSQFGGFTLLLVGL